MIRTSQLVPFVHSSLQQIQQIKKRRLLSYYERHTPSWYRWVNINAVLILKEIKYLSGPNFVGPKYSSPENFVNYGRRIFWALFFVALYSLVNIGKQYAVFEFNRKKIGNILRDKKRTGSPTIVTSFANNW